MFITCDRKELTSGLQKVQRGVAKKTTMPLLKGVKLEVKKDKLILASSNLEISVQTVIPAMVKEEGCIVLQNDFLYNIVRKFEGENVTFEEKTKGIITVSCGRSTCKIKGWPADEFPEFSKINNGYSFEISAQTLTEMIKQTLYAVSVNESLPILTGEKWEVKKNALTAVSTDGSRMSVHIGKLSKGISEEPLSIVVPGESLKELLQILPDNGDITIQLGRSQIYFKIEKTIFTASLLEGTFVDYKRVIPKEKNTVIKVNRETLLECCERSSILADDNHHVIVFSINDELVIQTESCRGKSKEVLPMQKWGDDLTIAFNAQFLIEALQSSDDDFIKMRLIDPESPVLFSSENGTLVTLIMPVRVS